MVRLRAFFDKIAIGNWKRWREIAGESNEQEFRPSTISFALQRSLASPEALPNPAAGYLETPKPRKHRRWEQIRTVQPLSLARRKEEISPRLSSTFRAARFARTRSLSSTRGARVRIIPLRDSPRKREMDASRRSRWEQAGAQEKASKSSMRARGKQLLAAHRQIE